MVRRTNNLATGLAAVALGALAVIPVSLGGGVGDNDCPFNLPMQVPGSGPDSTPYASSVSGRRSSAPLPSVVSLSLAEGAVFMQKPLPPMVAAATVVSGKLVASANSDLEATPSGGQLQVEPAASALAEQVGSDLRVTGTFRLDLDADLQVLLHPSPKATNKLLAVTVGLPAADGKTIAAAIHSEFKSLPQGAVDLSALAKSLLAAGGMNGLLARVEILSAGYTAAGEPATLLPEISATFVVGPNLNFAIDSGGPSFGFAN